MADMGGLLAGLGGGIWTLAAFVIALSVIVAVHEFGHYIVGRWSGIRAEVFSIGFGPRLFSRRDRRGTEWQVAALPLGGYVRFLGDSDAASAGEGVAVEPALRRQTLDGAPLWARSATVVAGPVFNFILSTLIFAGFLLVQGVPVETPTVGAVLPAPAEVQNQLRPGDEIIGVGGQPVAEWRDLLTVTETLPAAPSQDWRVRRDGVETTVRGPDPLPNRIGGVAPGSAAAQAGLRAGDVILRIDDTPIHRFDQIRPLVEAAAGAPLSLLIWREGTEVAVTLEPREQDLPLADGGYEKRWLIGISGGSFFEPATTSVGPLTALWQGVAQVGSIIMSSLTGLWAMISGQIGACNLSGALTIAETTGQAADAGIGNFIWWIAILSVAIGFLNLLPIPVLDGGHLAFYAYEAITGRPPSPRIMGLLTSIGLALVLGLMIFGLSNDLRC